MTSSAALTCPLCSAATSAAVSTCGPLLAEGQQTRLLGRFS